MKLENQVCSLELSKRLKELGVKQESLFYWGNFWGGNEFDILDYFKFDWRVVYKKRIACFGSLDNTGSKIFSAFTAAELFDLLPFEILEYCEESEISSSYRLFLQKTNGNEYYIYYEDKHEPELHFEEDIYLSNALARMLIYLLENGIIKNDNS